MTYQKKVKGEKLYLSPMNLTDLNLYYKWFNDPDITDGFGVTYLQNTLESEREWLEDCLKKQSYFFTVVKYDGDIALGGVWLDDVNQIHRRATLSIFIGDAENRGKGYGTEALKLVLKFAFDVLNLNNIYLNVFEFNLPALKSYKKVGFKEIGRRRQAYYLNNRYYDIIEMDIIREDWY